MAFVNFPEPEELKVDFVHRTGDSKPKEFNMYSVENPHPGFGTDPNILNELGHTKFPMWVDSKLEGKRVIVENEEELKKHTEEKPAVPSTATGAANQQTPAWPST